jgi:hypothetical protein
MERLKMEQEKERIAKLEKDYKELSAYTIEYVKNNPQVIGTLLKNWRVPKRDESPSDSTAQVNAPKKDESPVDATFPPNGIKPEGLE